MNQTDTCTKPSLGNAKIGQPSKLARLKRLRGEPQCQIQEFDPILNDP